MGITGSTVYLELETETVLLITGNKKRAQCVHYVSVNVCVLIQPI